MFKYIVILAVMIFSVFLLIDNLNESELIEDCEWDPSYDYNGIAYTDFIYCNKEEPIDFVSFYDSLIEQDLSVQNDFFDL
jgi:hypothetical protein